jgi:hypothetical protein
VDKCKWVFGEPSRKGWLYCGEDAHRGSWCEKHYKVVFVPVPDSLDRMVKKVAFSDNTIKVRRYTD